MRIDKYGILDVRVKLKNGVQIDFEMQVVYYDYWANRSAYYLGKMYVDQIREGDSYDRLQKCIQVSILDHTYFPRMMKSAIVGLHCVTQRQGKSIQIC